MNIRGIVAAQLAGAQRVNELRGSEMAEEDTTGSSFGYEGEEVRFVFCGLR